MTATIRTVLAWTPKRFAMPLQTPPSTAACALRRSGRSGRPGACLRAAGLAVLDFLVMARVCHDQREVTIRENPERTGTSEGLSRYQGGAGCS